MTRLWRNLRAVAGRRRFERDLSDELRFHIEQYAADLTRGGLRPDEAMRRARLEFGNVDNVKDDCRASRGLRLMDALHRDALHAVRLLRRSPGFTLTALATMAICLGANLTIFAVVDSILVRPMPFPDADRLVSVYNTYPKAGVPNDGCSLTNYYERRGRISAFASLAAYRDGTAVVGETGATEQVAVTRVSPEYFATLGIMPLSGRAFTEAETAYGAQRVAILSDGFWRQQLGADPAAVGRSVRVDGVQTRIVGILPPAFRFLSSKTRVYLPLASNPEERSPRQRHAGNSDMIARLGPGVSVSEAQAEIDAHNAALEADNPMAQAMADAGFRSIVVPLRSDHVATVRPVLLLVQAGALLLLLIGIVNLVNLLLMRASGRAKERAVRQAVGAGRHHIIAEVLVETTVLAVAGGLLGLGVGAAGVRLLSVLGVEHLPMGANVVFDVRLAVIGLAAAGLMGIVMGLPVAAYCLRHRATSPLHDAARGSTPPRAAQRLRHGFIVAQIALAFVLLSAAGLLALSLERAMAMPAGFRPEQVISARITTTPSTFRDRASLLTFTDRLLVELARLPGVQAAGIATNVPLSGISNKSAVTVKGYVRKPGESPQGNYSYSVGGDFFTAIGATLIEGRFLTARDSRGSARAAVVDQNFARYYWPRGSALGQRLFIGPEERTDDEAFTIVGVIRPMKQADLTDHQSQGAAYFPFGHRPDGHFFVLARTTRPPASVGGTLADLVRRLNPEQPVNDIVPMEARVVDSLVARRSPAVLAGLFSGIALLLTVIGTYGVLSYAVTQRRREIALRMALGARPDQVRAHFLSLAVRLVACGTAAGLCGAWAAGRAMQGVLFQVPPLHPEALAVTAIVIGTISAGACLVPSQRAARVSPIETLGNE